MKRVTKTNFDLPPDKAIVIIDIPPYGRIKLGDDKKTAFPKLNKLIAKTFEQVGCKPEDGYPAINVANILIEKLGGEILEIEYPDVTGIVY